MQYSVVNYKTVKENSDFRIDGEYYHPAILNRLNLLEGKNNDFLYNLVKFIVGPFGSTVTVDKYVGESDYRYIRNKDINDFVISNDDTALIPENVYSPLKQFHVQKDDLLLTVVGTLGKVAIAQEKDNKSIFSCKSTLLRSRKLNPYYLLTYLNSPTGQIFSLRGKRGAIQEGLNLTDLKDIKVFIPSSDFQKFIENLIKKSFSLLESSKSFYSQAEQLLLSELGLLEWKPKHTLSFVKNFSDTQEADRFDAEYFQPKYEEIIETVKKYKGGFVELDEVAKTKRGSLIPDTFYDENNGTPYIRGADFSSGFLSYDKLVYIDNSFSSKSETKIKKGDIVFALIGTVGSTALVDENFEGAFISNNLGKITIKNYNSTVLQVLLHSIAGRLYFKKEQTQTAQPKISDKDIYKFILPKLEYKIERDIEQKYFESQKNKKLSKSLLEIAKRGVEMAIEKDEKEAEEWIENKLKELKNFYPARKSKLNK
jgi:restriction endonuclease S subunit